MAKHYNQGVFQPKNPSKYIGTFPITYRSAWELTFMNLCDKHPNIVQWASESLKIPYQHPLTGRPAAYIPDFLIIYIDKNGQRHGELVEIKPRNQAVKEAAKGGHNKREYVVNQAKWAAADAWCKKHGLTFRVVTEQELYRGAKR